MQEKKLLDMPKLLDICAIYGHENEDLTRSLVSMLISILVVIVNDWMLEAMVIICSLNLFVLLLSNKLFMFPAEQKFRNFVIMLVLLIYFLETDEIICYKREVGRRIINPRRFLRG